MGKLRRKINKKLGGQDKSQENFESDIADIGSQLGSYEAPSGDLEQDEDRRVSRQFSAIFSDSRADGRTKDAVVDAARGRLAGIEAFGSDAEHLLEAARMHFDAMGAVEIKGTDKLAENGIEMSHAMDHFGQQDHSDGSLMGRAKKGIKRKIGKRAGKSAAKSMVKRTEKHMERVGKELDGGSVRSTRRMAAEWWDMVQPGSADEEKMREWDEAALMATGNAYADDSVRNVRVAIDARNQDADE